MDPQGPFDFSFAIERASTTANPGFPCGFSLPLQSTNTTTNQSAHDHFSALPPELRFRILEMLPTNAVLDLFLASPTFRELSHNLPTSFWRSRLFFEVPWCAELVLPQIKGQARDSSFYRQLLREVKSASETGEWISTGKDGWGGWDQGYSTKESLGLRKRCQVWLNCESILNGLKKGPL